VGTLKRYYKTLEYEYKVKTAALDTLRPTALVSAKRSSSEILRKKRCTGILYLQLYRTGGEAVRYI
jgi:hypothetical protein